MVLLSAASWLVAGPAASKGLTVMELALWSEGPVQWLLLADERKQLRRVSDTTEALAFIERFWARRDWDPDDDGNPFRETFSQRVEAADVLYGEGNIRGSLTDRGRALILLGPPTHVTVTTEPALAWDPASDSSRVRMRRVEVEVWGYRLEDLPAGVLELWLDKKKRATDDPLVLTVTFRTVASRTSLVEGEALLETAVRAAVHRSGDS